MKCDFVIEKFQCCSISLEKMERVKGIEPSSQAWEARILPLNHTRLRSDSVGATAGRPAFSKRVSVLPTRSFTALKLLFFTRLVDGWQLV
jgi:hypothetical protein